MQYREIKEFARKLRNNSTPAERKLWYYLKNGQLEGRRFLRQHPVKYGQIKTESFWFIPDFYCRKEMLIIELDGPIHRYTIEKDRRKDEILKSKGYNVIRIENHQLENITKVLQIIKSSFKEK